MMKVLTRYLVCAVINTLVLYNSVAIADQQKIGNATNDRAGSPTLRLAELENRLCDTGAIGFFQKLSLKGQVDELIDEFRAFHAGDGADIASLRQDYNALMSETLEPLKAGDPDLYKDIVRSRVALWTMLADPVKFASL